MKLKSFTDLSILLVHRNKTNHNQTKTNDLSYKRPYKDKFFRPMIGLPAPVVQALPPAPVVQALPPAPVSWEGYNQEYTFPAIGYGANEFVHQRKICNACRGGGGFRKEHCDFCDGNGFIT